MTTANPNVPKKKEVQKKIRGILMHAIGMMGIKTPSKKLKREVKAASRNVCERLIHDLGKLNKPKQTKSKSVKAKVEDQKK